MILPLKVRPVYTLKKKLPPCLKPSLTLDHKHFICLLYALNLSFFSYLLYWNKNKGIIYCTNFLPVYHLSALLMSNLLSRLTFAVEISHNDTGEKNHKTLFTRATVTRLEITRCQVCLYFIFFFNGKPPLFLFMASKKCNFYLLAKLCLIIKWINSSRSYVVPSSSGFPCSHLFLSRMILHEPKLSFFQIISFEDNAPVNCCFF